MSRLPRALTGLVVLGVLAACGTSIPTASHTVGMVTLEVSGGFTGWDRLVIVDQDGSAHMKSMDGRPVPASVVRVEATTLARLHALVSDDAFAALQAAYLPPPGGADLQDYAITAEVDGRQRQTMTRDGASRPQILDDVLAILSAVLASIESGAAASPSS